MESKENLLKWHDKEYCLQAIKQNEYALKYIKNQTEKICLEAVKRNGLNLKYVKNQTEEICLEAIKQNWKALQYVRNRTDKIYLEAIKQNSWTLQYVHNQTEKMCLEAVKQNGWALQYVKDQTEKVCLEAVKQNGLALQYIKNQTEKICLEAVKNGHKVLVFTNYINSIENICKELKSHGINHISMTGATKNRQELVEKFQTVKECKVFIMTLKTGGVGLNLTAADKIFIYDPWWNKTAEDQAVDRSYRMGQDRTVFAYKLITKGTIEEKMLSLQMEKNKLFNSLITTDTVAVKSLSESDIEYMLGV